MIGNALEHFSNSNTLVIVKSGCTTLFIAKVNSP